MSNVVVRKANLEDIGEYYNIIVNRCIWFKQNNIFQWDDDYPIRFNENYFKNSLVEDEIFVAVKDNKVVGGVLIRDKDIYYSRVGKALYMHHFVTKVGEDSIGEILIDFIVSYCRKQNKEYLRLDVISSNEVLNNYYINKGFICTGTEKKRYHYYNLYEMKI